MQNKSLIALTILALTMLCCRTLVTQKIGAGNWNNPALSCAVPEITEKIFIEVGESRLVGEEGIRDFCLRMNRRFRHSNMSREDAVNIYDILSRSGLTLDEDIGMPDPDSELQPTKDFSSAVALKKVDESLYEIFFVKTACGKTYFHGQFKLPEEPEKLNILPIEVWRASYPC